MTISKNLSLVGLGFAALLMLVAAPASATTVAGYYDQFGNYHFYQTYTYPNDAYGYSGTAQYGYGSSANGIYAVRPVSYGSAAPYCPSGYTYNTFNGICAPVGQQTGSVVTSFSNGIASSATGASKSTTASKTTGATGQASALSTLFGAKDAGPLAISNVAVVSGPKNINDASTDTNCSVSVSWTTNVASAGQVVYGTVSQPKVDSFSYPSVVAEGTSLTKQHQVKLGCLSNSTYYFRVIAFSKDARAVSDEQTIFPIKIRGAVPAVASAATTVSGGSALGTVVRILLSPVVLAVLILLLAAYIIMKIVRKGAGGHAGGHGSQPDAHAEPVLEIPHH